MPSQLGTALALAIPGASQSAMIWTPNQVTFLRFAIGFISVALFGHYSWLNLLGRRNTHLSSRIESLEKQA